MGRTIPIALATDPVRDTLSRPLSDLRISVIDRCNHRCPYCMPAEAFHEGYPFLRREQWLGFDEIERVARIMAELGVRKLRLTGGEPLLRPGLPDLVRRLAAIPGIEDLALTSNGVLLPRQARALKEAGLQRVTISLDSLEPQTHKQLSGGRGDVRQTLEGIAEAERCGLAPIKINCVVLRGINDHQLIDLLAHFRGTPHVVRFIEYMDVGTLNQWRQAEVVPSTELRQKIEKHWPLRALPPAAPGEVANRYAYADGSGEIGFISSVSKPFCGDCSRARLSADGQLFTCLFARHGHDLRGPLRAGASDQEMRGLVSAVWAGRQDRYSEQRAARRGDANSEHVEMFHIGG
ncbi:MAG: GTP 3',8-cyclase MoaA [Rhodanobacteraceae bacterium]